LEQLCGVMRSEGSTLLASITDVVRFIVATATLALGDIIREFFVAANKSKCIGLVLCKLALNL